MLRIAEDLSGRAGLHNSRGVHDDDAIRHGRGDLEIVGDHDQRHSGLALEVAQQFEDLGLNTDVQGGRRLVRDQNVGLQRNRHGNHHTLALTAGKLVRIEVNPAFRFRNADAAEELNRVGTRLPALPGAVALIDLLDLASDRVDGIEIGERILEDHRNPAAVDASAGFRIQTREFDAIEVAGACDDIGRWAVEEVHHRARADALSRAAFTENDEGLAAINVEGDVVDRPYWLFIREEIDRQALDLENGIGCVLHRAAFRNVCRRQRCCGSATVRAQFERMLSESVVNMMARPGQKAIHQAVER